MRILRPRRWGWASAIIVLALVGLLPLTRGDIVLRMPAAVPQAPAHEATRGASEETPAPASTLPMRRVDLADTGIETLHIDTLRLRLQHSGLRESAPDGDVHVDGNGDVLADRALRHLFDWYLALGGEFSLPEMRTLLAADIHARHGADAMQQALALFDRYLDLQREIAAIDPALDDTARLSAQHTLRRRWFGDDAQAMFGDDEAALTHTLARLALRDDASLSEAERHALEQELDTLLPEDERAARGEAGNLTLAEEQSRQFDSLGTDAATRHTERTQLFGAEAADRLANLDAERTAWDTRVSDYLRQRDVLHADTGIDPATRATRLHALRQQAFAEHEQRRILALEQIRALPPGG